MIKKSNKKIVAIALVLTLVCSVFANYQVYAGGGYDFVSDLIQGLNDDETITAGATLTIDMNKLEESQSGFKDGYAAGKIEVCWMVGDEKRIPEYSSSTGLFTIKVREADAGKYYCFNAGGEYHGTNFNNNTKSYLVKSKNVSGESKLDMTIDKKGIATVTGTTTGTATFSELLVDEHTKVSSLSGKSFKVTFDTKNFDIGYHNLSAELSDGKIVYFEKAFPSSIYDTPKLTASCFETFKNKLAFSTPSHNGYKYDYYLEFKKSSEKWEKAKVYGPFDPNSQKVIDKLKPGTKYNCKAVFVKTVKYGGKTYYFTGPKTKEVTIKTGPKSKPKVKSIKISKAKIRKIWVNPLYEGLKLVAKGFWTYQTTYTVTVKFKKKPNVAGMYIHASSNSPLYQYVKGNKKTYKCKFTVGGKAIGKKSVVRVYSKGNKTYGAYSPVYKKKVKVKK